MATQNGSEVAEEIRQRGQQPMLASQRAKEASEAQQGRFSKWFPLSAKEGFDQVCSLHVAHNALDWANSSSGGQA